VKAKTGPTPALRAGASVSPHACDTPDAGAYTIPERSGVYGAALEAILDGHYDNVDELLSPFTPAQLRRLALAAQDLAHLARSAALRPYLHLDDIARLGQD
jgi:hypothetical protein